MRSAAEVLDLASKEERGAAVDEAERAGVEVWEVHFLDCAPDPGEPADHYHREVPGTYEEVEAAALAWAKDVGALVVEIVPLG